MLEFVTQDTFECPYCKSDLENIELSTIDGTDYWKFCNICNKRFEIAEFTLKRIEKLQKEKKQC